MPDGTDREQTEAAETKDPKPARSKRQRLAIWLGGSFATVLLLFVLVVFVLPTPVARYVIESQLEDLGIRHNGIDTVDIDLWNSRVVAGPIAFRSGEAQEGQVGETGFDYSFGELFNGRAFVRTFYLRGVDVYVTRLEGGDIEINGISLRRQMTPEAETAEAQSEAEAEEPGFGYGGDSFEFADSRLVFQDVTGGTLTMDLERLTLERLRSWTPNEPTAFAFKGRLNEIEMALDGTIVPLGDPLIATLNTRVTGMTLDRIAEFIGPTGLARQDGTVDTEVHYNYAIYSSGRIEGKVDGTYNINGVRIATEDGGTADLDKAILKVNLHQQLQADGSAVAKGQVKLAGGRLAFGNAAGDLLEVGALDFALENLNLRKGTERRERLREAILAGAVSETTPSIVELLVGWARELGQNALNHRLSIDGAPSVTLKDGLLRLAASDGAPGREMRFDQARVDLGEVASEARDASVVASSTLDAVVTGLRLAMQDGSAEASLAEAGVNSRTVDFQATREETALTFDLGIELQKIAAGNRDGAAVDLGWLAVTTESYRIAETAESEDAAGPVVVALQELTARLPGAEGEIALRGDDVTLSLSPFTLAGKQGEAASFAGSIAANGLALERAGEAPLSASLAATRTDLTDFRVAPLDATAEITGGLATSLSDIRVEAMQETESLSLTLQNLETQAEELQVSGLDSDSPRAALSNLTRLSGLAARRESADGKGRQTLSLDSLENRIDQLQASNFTGAAPEVALSGLTRLSGLTASREDGDGKGRQTLSLDSLENRIDQLQASNFTGAAPEVALSNHVKLSGLSASLPLDGERRAEASIASLDAPLSELTLSGGAVGARGAIEVTGISAESDGDAPQSLDLASLSVTGLAGDSENGITIERLALGLLEAKLNLDLPGPKPAAASDEVSPAGETAAATAEQSDTSPTTLEFERQFKLGAFSLAPGSRIEITDKGVEPPLQASLVLNELHFGPVDTAAPETRTNLALALSANETSKVALRGWVAPLKPKPDFELVSEVEGLSLPVLSPYAALATGVNIESGELFAGIDASASESALAGKIDLRINDLFVTPLTEEEAKRIEADIGLPVGFAVSILKNSEGIIAFGLPLSGTVEAPEVDYSEAIDKAISGAMASIFPTNWFGPDGNTFKMQPAPFEPGTTELTKEGLEVADQMGGLFADKPGISIRACGRAGRADLVALRGDFPALPSDTVMPAGAPMETAAPPQGSGEAGGGTASAGDSTADAAAAGEAEQTDAIGEAVAALPPPTEKEISPPNDEEVQALLALAAERGLAVRKYLEAKYGVDPGQVPECRTTYSIEDGKPPRAEFQF